MNKPAGHQLSRKALRQARSRKSVKVSIKAPELRRVLTMVVASGLMATTALPSYGYDPEVTALTGMARDHSVQAPKLQELSVAIGTDVEFTRGEFTPADAEDFEVTIRRSRVYTGPTIEDYLAKPRFTTVTSGNVMKAAAEFVGVPYVFGGASPLGFDCSGYVMFVYSQFGVRLPHSVYQQSKLAKKIKLEDAVPGDIVVFNDYSHNGIYAGNGNFYHSPQPGDRVKLAPIFTERYHIVRFVDIVD